MSKNIFLDIIEGKIPAEIIFQDEHCLAFHDISPQAPTHVLIIPRKEIRTHNDIEPADAERLGAMHLAAQQIARQLELTSYRLVINCEEGAGQTVPHLHMHLLGGRSLSWPPG